MYFIIHWLLPIFSALSLNPDISSTSVPEPIVNDTVSLFNFFYNQSDKPLLKIDTDLGKLINKKMKEEEQPGTISFVSLEGKDITLPMEIRARGNIRKEVCYYPPVRINLKKPDLKQAGFKKLDKLKFVLQCKANKTGASYLEREFLIYELYTAIDPYYVRTKMVEIEFWEGDDLKKTLEGFLVEEETHFAKRLDGKVLETQKIMSPSLQRDHYLKMAFFQYMVANTDWSIVNKHNVEIIKVPGIPRVLAVPYDFDYAGLVGTSYAIPHTSVPIANVKQRYFKGFQVTEEEAVETIAYFQSMKDRFLEICDNADYLTDGDRKDIKEFIEEFYKMCESEKRIKRTFVTMKK